MLEIKALGSTDQGSAPARDRFRLAVRNESRRPFGSRLPTTGYRPGVRAPRPRELRWSRPHRARAALPGPRRQGRRGAGEQPACKPPTAHRKASSFIVVNQIMEWHATRASPHPSRYSPPTAFHVRKLSTYSASSSSSRHCLRRDRSDSRPPTSSEQIASGSSGASLACERGAGEAIGGWLARRIRVWIFAAGRPYAGIRIQLTAGGWDWRGLAGGFCCEGVG